MENQTTANEPSSQFLEGIGESLARFSDSSELLQKILDTIPQAVFWKDKNLTYLGCNQLFAKCAGIANPQNLIGLTDFDLPWDQKETEFYHSCDQRVMSNDAPELGIVESQVNANGDLTWLETSKVPVHDENGDVIGILGTCCFITRLKFVVGRASFLPNRCLRNKSLRFLGSMKTQTRLRGDTRLIRHAKHSPET
jgi:PAS domain S-box-containing protein